MLDCGIHPGFSGINSLPFFDEIDLDTVDAMLITHFHLDHCAAVPYVVGKTNFKARLRHCSCTVLSVLEAPLQRHRFCTVFVTSSSATAAYLLHYHHFLCL